MLGSTILSIERPKKNFRLFFAESSTALVGSSVLTAEVVPNRLVSLIRNSRPYLRPPSHHDNVASAKSTSIHAGCAVPRR